MNKKQLLIDRSIPVTESKNGRITWYTPLEVLKSYSSVIDVNHFNTTSSAGDWEGYFIQKIKENLFYMILFNQDNNYPKAGYTIYTQSSPLIKLDSEPDENTINEILEYYLDCMQ